MLKKRHAFSGANIVEVQNNGMTTTNSLKVDDCVKTGVKSRRPIPVFAYPFVHACRPSCDSRVPSNLYQYLTRNSTRDLGWPFPISTEWQDCAHRRRKKVRFGWPASWLAPTFPCSMKVLCHPIRKRCYPKWPWPLFVLFVSLVASPFARTKCTRKLGSQWIGQQYVAFTLLAQLGMLLVVTPWLLALSGMEMAIGHGGRHDKCCTCRGHFQDQNNQEVDDGQVRLFLSTRSASALRALREAYLSFTSKNYILK